MARDSHQVSVCNGKTPPIEEDFEKQRFGFGKKGNIWCIDSMGLSVLTLHAGTWYNLTRSEMEAWKAGVFRAYQSLQIRMEDGTIFPTCVSMSWLEMRQRLCELS